MFDDKKILITGGTGSFGRKCVQQLLGRYKPRQVVIYSRDELKQFEMGRLFHGKNIRYVIGDVRDAGQLRTAMKGMNFVIHVAALKQVPTAEQNPMECIKTNIHGAQNVIDAALTNGVEKVIALSTDKAANPINLYGATKLCSDKLFVAANNLSGGQGTRFGVVRYGNVVGSRGSVVPFFLQLVKEGAKELPITDERMTRFWITPQHGIEFVFQAFRRMNGGEIFVPKIPSMRIMDLAEALAPGLKTRIVGIRPGEKLHEVMCPRDDCHLTREFNDHYVITPGIEMVFTADYQTNQLGETSQPVPRDFEYESGNNPDFLTVEQLRNLPVD